MNRNRQLPPHRPRFGRSSALPLAILAFVSALAGGCSSSQSRAVAEVGGQSIRASDLVHTAETLPPGAVAPTSEGKRQLLDELVSRALLVAEAKRRGYDKDPDLRMTLVAARQSLLPQVLYSRVVGGRVRVTEDEARAIWDRLDQEWRLSQIFTFDEPEARMAVERLKRGTPFASVATTVSRDRQTGMQGGDLGYVTSGQIPREMEEAVSRLKVGQWTGPLRTPVGWYLVQLTDRRPRQREPFESVRDNIMALLRQRKERTLVLAYVSRLKERRRLTSHPEAYQVLAEKWQNQYVESLLVSRGDPARLGFTPHELTLPLETWDGGSYPLSEFFADMKDRANPDRPTIEDDVALRLYVQDRAVNRMILSESQLMGLDSDEELLQQLKDRENSYLITRLYEEVIVPSARITPEEQEQLRARLSMQLQGADPSIFARFEEQFLEGKRRRLLQEWVDRLRREHPPKVNERALAAVPWPVAPKENS